MSEPETRARNDHAFAWVCQLMLADDRGEFAKAARAQARLAELGWYVARRPLEEPPKPKRRRSKPAAGEAVTQ